MSVIELDPNATKREMPAIYAEFYTEEVPDEEATKKAGHVVYRSVDKVRWGRRGQNLNVLDDRITRIQKNADVWRVMAPAYEAWKKGQEAPLSGTPLKMWPAITKAQAATLQGVGIRTVEELMELTDGDADRIGIMEIRRLRNRAKLWKDAAQDTGKLAERMNAIEEAMKLKDERIAQLEKDNASLHQALVDSGKVQPVEAPQPRKRA